MARLSTKAILNQIGEPKLSLYHGEGYWYFAYDDPENNIFETDSIYTPRLSDLRMDAWVATGNALVEKVAERIRDRADHAQH